jgi:hypothetical protein
MQILKFGVKISFMNYLEQLKKYFEQEKKRLEKLIENEKATRDGSPSAMQSHHDTTRNQTEKLIQVLELQLKELENNLGIIPNNLPKQNSKINLWSLIDIELGTNKLLVILVPAGLGGKKFDNFQTLAINSPLGTIIENKKESELFEINGSKGKIIKIT